MQISSPFKTILTACTVLLIVSCSSKSKDKVKVTEITLQDIKQEEEKFEPPPPPPPPKDLLPTIIEIKGGITKCFVSDGLKFKTTVTLIYNEKEVAGIVMSEEYDSGKKRSTAFAGTMDRNKFTVSFKNGDPPLIGDASEWTNKPWTVKKEGAKETLHIIFNAKNYDTNKWGDIDYQFELVDCK